MTYLLTTKDIPMFWEVIKRAVQAADGVKESYLAPYLTEVLHSLLSSKAHCFVRLNENREIEALAITRVIVDKFTGELTLFVQCLYSWKVVSPDVWQGDIDLLTRFAKSQNCTSVSCRSDIPRMWELYAKIGLREVGREFSADI